MMKISIDIKSNRFLKYIFKNFNDFKKIVFEFNFKRKMMF